MLVTDLRSLSDTNRGLIEGGLAAIGDALLSVRAAVGRHLRLHRPRRRGLAPRRHAGRRTVSSFATLNTARTALWAQQRAIDVTGQNIANVNTDGYSRQRAELQSLGGSTVPAFFSTSSGIGSGVDAAKVARIRDAFLEGRAHQEYANNAQLTVENESFDLVEQAFREPGDTGVQSLLSKMWAGWGDVANQPQDLAARSQVLQRLGTLVGGLHAGSGVAGRAVDPDPREPRRRRQGRQRRRRLDRRAQPGDQAGEPRRAAGQRAHRPARQPGHEARGERGRHDPTDRGRRRGRHRRRGSRWSPVARPARSRRSAASTPPTRRRCRRPIRPGS